MVPQPILVSIAARRPDLWLMIGDNVYAANRFRLGPAPVDVENFGELTLEWAARG